MAATKLPPSVLEPIARFAGTAIFVGGTSGIGRSMALQLARNSKAPCEIILVGRNKAKADSIIDLMKTQASTEHRYSFRSCDVTSFANVRKLCAGIKADHDKVNLLFMTCGFVSMGGRKENNDVEKTDTKMAAHFYSRNLIVKELLPLLEKAQQATGDARVISVLDPAWGPGKLDYDDLELKNTFGLGKCAKHTTTMTNVILEDFAARTPSVSFIHAYPAWVNTGVGDGLPLPLRLIGAPFVRLFATDPDVYAGRATKALFDPRYRTGFWRLDQNGEPITKPMAETGEEARSKVRQHFEEVTSRGA